MRIVTRVVLALLLSSPFFWIGHKALGMGGLLVGVAVLLICAGIIIVSIMMAFPAAQRIAEPWGEVFFPNKRFKRAQPMYGIPESRRAMGLYEQAMAEYEKITAEHPSELKPYLEMVDIAVDNLNDIERAREIFQRGMAALKKDADKKKLTKIYEDTLT